jgi:hypothetical protein
MDEIIDLEARSAPTAVDEHVGFAVTNVRKAIAVQFPVDDDLADGLIEELSVEE